MSFVSSSGENDCGSFSAEQQEALSLTSEYPHGSVYSVVVAAGQRLHENTKQLRPCLRPVPGGDG